MLKIFSLLIIIFFIISLQKGKCQSSDKFRIAFYNVENLFDTIDATDKKDEEFTPSGIKGWNEYRYHKKLNHIYKTLIAIKEWGKLPVVGLCEIENKTVLKDLIYQTPLFQFNYQYIHRESPDERGVDVALLYDNHVFQPLDTCYYTLVFPDDPQDKTRDILYVKGLVYQKDTLHIFVNHWPSRYGGYMATRLKRLFAAKTLAAKADSILKRQPLANIVAMGDFNDTPADTSIKFLSHTLTQITPVPDQSGTTKYRSQWSVFDQMLVSPQLLKKGQSLHIPDNTAHIAKPEFLLEKDIRYGGQKPYRTYSGPRYQGGFSDHLPVYISLQP
jgi:predicted extracellular nuclease